MGAQFVDKFLKVIGISGNEEDHVLKVKRNTKFMMKIMMKITMKNIQKK